MKILLYISLLGFAGLLVFGCKKDSDNVFDAAKQAIKDADSLSAYFQKKGIKDSVTKTSSGLYYRITKRVPDSIQIDSGYRVFVRYEGRLLKDLVFDSNLLKAKAYEFIPGNGSVIKAWEEGILLFRKGEEGYLYAPSSLGYGNTPQNGIPANSCLVFYIRIANVEP